MGAGGANGTHADAGPGPKARPRIGRELLEDLGDGARADGAATVGATVQSPTTHA